MYLTDALSGALLGRERSLCLWHHVSEPRTPRRSCIRASSSGATRMHRIGPTGSIIGQEGLTRHTALRRSTGKSGKTSMGRSRRAGISITGTVIRSTMSRPIWSVCPDQRIKLSTVIAPSQRPIKHVAAPCWIPSERRLVPGMEPRPVSPGMQRMDAQRGQIVSRSPRLAWFVVRSFRHTLTVRGTARRAVKNEHVHLGSRTHSGPDALRGVTWTLRGEGYQP